MTVNQEREVKKHFTIINPQYQMTLAMIKKDASKRKMLYAIPKDFGYYKKCGSDFIVGRGAAHWLMERFQDDITYEIARISPKMNNQLPEKIQLRHYQPGVATKVLEHYQGVLKLGTGWGKTIMAFRLAEKTQLRTLIVCCKSEATELYKYKNDFKAIYGLDIGVIQEKSFDIKDVTVATVSTLVKRDISKIANEFGMVIVDECHVGMSEKRLEAFSKFNCERFYGMSGTPGRANGQGKALDFYYGPILVDEKLPQTKPVVHVYKTNVELVGDEYYEMEAISTTNVKRNYMIAVMTRELMNQGRRILILTKRIEHGETLKLAVDNDDIIALSSKDPAKMRSELIQAVRDERKDFQVLIGTYGLFSTGIDIPLLDTVILGMSIKVDGEYDATLVQSVGRILRLHDKKQTPLIIDLDDNLNKIMHRHHISRMKVYKREGWEIVFKN